MVASHIPPCLTINCRVRSLQRLQAHFFIPINIQTGSQAAVDPLFEAPGAEHVVPINVLDFRDATPGIVTDTGIQEDSRFVLGYSPVKVTELQTALSNYPNQKEAQELLDGFTYGFHLEYEGPRHSYQAVNLKSANENPAIVRHKIITEIQAGRVAGPFSATPFVNFRISPLGLVPKKQPGEFRLIHHLSYPAGESVNDYIDPSLCSVQYTRFDKAVEMVQGLGPGALLAKADIKSAFRLLPVSPQDFELLGFQFDNKYYFDKCLPFGCSLSCALFEKFANCLEFLVRNTAVAGHIVHYLDDYLGAGRPNSEDCQHVMDIFAYHCAKLGVPLAEDKCEGPQTKIVFLGLELDSVRMQVRVPIDKVHVLCEQILDTLQHRSIQLKPLQSLIGSLNFMCRAISPGRPFCRRLINATCGLVKPHHHLRITKGMRQDLEMWLLFFQAFNGISIFQDQFWTSNADFSLYTDS
ncbi:MAG: reverse transcriptase domain-containing protein, partial [Sedimenticola sp.]